MSGAQYVSGFLAQWFIFLPYIHASSHIDFTMFPSVFLPIACGTYHASPFDFLFIRM